MAANWQVAFLHAIKAPVTTHNVAFLTSWWKQEGGDLTNNAKFNWLNTTQGSQYPAINSVGVRSFPSFQTGISELRSVFSNYPNLIRALRSGSPSLNDPGVQADLNKWLTGKPTTGMSQYIQRIAGSLGSPVTSFSSNPSKTIGGSISGAQGANGGVLQAAVTDPVSGEAQVSLKPGAARALSVEAHVQTIPFKVQIVRSGKASDGTPLPSLQAHIDSSVPNDPKVKGVLQLAQHYLGTKYVYGGNTPSGFDCSGFVQWVYDHMGVQLPRTTWDQMKVGTKVNTKNLKAGDVLFFDNGGHEALYIGNGRVIQAPHTGTVVQITALKNMGPIYQARRMA